MNDKKPFSAIIIDTNAFDRKGNDFCGFYSTAILSLFETIDRLGLKLLSHPILRGETLKHINEGDLKNRPEQAKISLIRNKTVIELAGIKIDNIIQKVEQLDLCRKTVDAYNNSFVNAIMLGFPAPEKIFEKYFNGILPFSKGNKKKSEFPDAFVIGAIENYISENPQAFILVVSNDKDWIDSFKDNPNISLVNDIDSALSILNKTENDIKECVQVLYPDISNYINDNATMDVWFELDGYECLEDLNVEDVRLLRIDDKIVPLKFSEEEWILQIKLDLLVDGSTTVFDYDRSVWDREDNNYIIKEFSVLDFRDAIGEITAELYIRKDLSKKPVLEHMWLIAPFGVILKPNMEKVYYTKLFSDDGDY